MENEKKIKAAYLIPIFELKWERQIRYKLTEYMIENYQFELKIENEHLPFTEGHPSWKICDW